MEYLLKIEELKLGDPSIVKLHKYAILEAALSPIISEQEAAEHQAKALYLDLLSSLKDRPEEEVLTLLKVKIKPEVAKHLCYDHPVPIKMEINDKINSLSCPDCGRIEEVPHMTMDELKPKVKAERNELCAKDFESLDEHLSMIEGRVTKSCISPEDYDAIMLSLGKIYGFEDEKKTRCRNTTVEFDRIVSIIRDMKLRRCCKFTGQIYKDVTGKKTIDFTEDEKVYIKERYALILRLFKKNKTHFTVNNLPTCNLLIWKIIQGSTFPMFRRREIQKYIYLPDTDTSKKLDTGFWPQLVTLDPTFRT